MPIPNSFIIFYLYSYSKHFSLKIISIIFFSYTMLISFSIFSSLLFCFTFSFLFSLCILGSPLLRFNFVQISCQPMGISCKPLRISCQPNGNILSTYGNILSTWERKSWPLSPQGRLRPRWAHPGLKQIIFRWGKWVLIFANCHGLR